MHKTWVAWRSFEDQNSWILVSPDYCLTTAFLYESGSRRGCAYYHTNKGKFRCTDMHSKLMVRRKDKGSEAYGLIADYDWPHSFSLQEKVNRPPNAMRTVFT